MNDPASAATTARNDVFRIRVLVLMGVSGSGKTVVGEAVANAWQARFEDADHWHTPAAVAQMASGQPLTDADRAPWLERLHQELIARVPAGARLVLACSALRGRYRNVLSGGLPEVRFVYLNGSKEVIASRLASRIGHYMPAGLLDSQFDALEPPGPEEAWIVQIDQPVEKVVADVLAYLLPPMR